MPRMSYLTREILCPILYYGARGAGKTTSIRHFLPRNTAPRGKPQHDDIQAQLTTRFDFIENEFSPKDFGADPGI